jgi:ribosomal protein L29
MKIVIGASTIFEKLRELKSQLFELKFGYDMEKINIVE